VRLMPPAYVKPYVKRHKNDAADAEAICEAVTRANMRFVATKTPEQQSCLMLHRTRHLFIRHQTSVINAIRAHLAESKADTPDGSASLSAVAGKADIQHRIAPIVSKRTWDPGWSRSSPPLLTLTGHERAAFAAMQRPDHPGTCYT